VTTPHLVLLGDSIFDNAAYFAGGPDIAAQLRRVAPDWNVTLCAVDGSTTTTFAPQADRIPATATHLVLSLGGNDALGHFDLLERSARSVAEGLTLLGDAAAAFDVRYRACVEPLLRRKLPLTLCTVYNGWFEDRGMARLAATALTVFDDVILRAAFELRVNAIDLRSICSDPGDYANPIEPSVQGGGKIARAIVESVTAPESPRRSCVTA
jgi:hypothetical protein